MTTTEDEFAVIRQFLADDERVAKAASPGPWDHGNDGLVWPPRIGDPVSGSTEIEDAEHIARWHPLRVLALTSALRQALDEFHFEAREYEVIVMLARALYADRLGFPEGWLR